MKNRDFLAKDWVPITHQNTLKSKKTPEMNELEPRQKILKIWTYNFEKQKSYRNFKILGRFFLEKFDFFVNT